MDNNQLASDKFREFGNSKEYKTIRRIENFTIHLYFLKRSYDDFIQFANSIIDNPLEEKNHPDNSIGKLRFMELIRLFFNYTASAAALIDSSRKFVKDLEVQGITIKEEYEKEVKKQFSDSITCQLIKGFRNMISHETAPEFSLTCNYEKEFKSYILYSKDQVLKHIELKSEAKKYINSIDSIDICILVKEYYSLITRFNTWFTQIVAERTKPIFDKYIEKQVDTVVHQNRLLISVLLNAPETPRKISIKYIINSFPPQQQEYIHSLSVDRRIKFIIDTLVKQKSLVGEQVSKFELILKAYFENNPIS